MKQPCLRCPFRKDKPFRGLTPERAVAIANTVLGDGLFYCHETTEGDRITPSSKQCFGALVFANNVRGTIRHNVCFRLLIATGGIDSEAVNNCAIPVYKNPEEFVNNVTLL